MSKLEDLVRKYYEADRYNCSETLIHAGNECYGLGLREEDMRMLAGFGSGMYSGSTCGTLIGSVAVISKLIVETKAHDHLDQLRPAVPVRHDVPGLDVPVDDPEAVHVRERVRGPGHQFFYGLFIVYVTCDLMNILRNSICPVSAVNKPQFP